MEKLGVTGTFLAHGGTYTHKALGVSALEISALVKSGNHDDVAAVQCRCTHAGEGISCSPGKATHCWGYRTPLGIYPAFWHLPRSFVVLWPHRS